MTKELLESYKSKRAEIVELQNRLRNIGSGVEMIGNDTILDYRRGYPVPEPVVGVDWEGVFRREGRYRNRITELEEECQWVEDFIENIPDSLTRRIFRMYYVEGLPQRYIAEKVHMDRSGISKKISDFIKLSSAL